MHANHAPLFLIYLKEINMVDEIIIGREERMTRARIMGEEFIYDVTDVNTIKKLEELSKIKSTDLEGTIEFCKEFLTLVFCNDPRPINKIEEVNQTSAQLWIDTVLQFTPLIKNPRIKAMEGRMSKLKKAADK